MVDCPGNLRPPPPPPLRRLMPTALIRLAEARALERHAPGALMDKAALAVADSVESMLRDLPAGAPVLGFCGPGNNGGDALLALCLLRQRGFPVGAYELEGAHARGRMPDDAVRARATALRDGIAPRRITDAAQLERILSGAGHSQHPGLARALVIDGLFGIGLTRPLEGLAALFCRLLAERPLAVVSIDVPSGIDGDTGAILGGASGTAVRADETVTMIADKSGLRTGAAVDHAGRVRVASLGIEDEWQGLDTGAGQLIDRRAVAGLLPARPRDSSKGSFGSVVVVGGASGMAGAALLAARGAQCSGAGKVSIVSPDEAVFDPGQPQFMSRPASAGFGPSGVLVVGCGLGTGPGSRALFDRALEQSMSRVLDADALNLLSTRAPPSTRHQVPTVLTPHPLEAARLLATDVATIQGNRIACALEIARRWAAVTVLKGAGTVIATEEGRWAILEPGGPALATAGSGDVLAGVIGGLLAQGLDARQAATLGCWAHAAAADAWGAASGWPAGLSAAELPDRVRTALASLA
jgi:ADP-dependent NAD(P)H-hydrate dehydratase / NAD(P)H-hydrate epimerase